MLHPSTFANVSGEWTSRNMHQLSGQPFAVEEQETANVFIGTSPRKVFWTKEHPVYIRSTCLSANHTEDRTSDQKL